MTVEAAGFINAIDPTQPVGTDPKSEGDDHLRNFKKSVQDSFPSITGAVTATHTELNLVTILDGVTSTTAELNILDGVTSTAAELNILDGVTATAAELNILDGVTATASEINTVADGITATAANINALQSTFGGKTLASSDDKIDNFPAGTLMLFQQTAAPTGWTKQVTHNNKALRVVSGTASSGGSSPFSTVFGKSATDAHTLLVAEMPAHTHNVDYYYYATGTVNQPAGHDGSLGVRLSKNTGSAGGDGGHTHNMDIRVQYVDLIIASKD